MEKYTWLEELIESCQSSEELFETICEYIDENFILIDDNEEKVSKSEYDSVISKYEKEISELKESFENEKAQALGATGSHFVNANGLQDENHYTTAYDLYLIFQAAMKYDDFMEILQTPEYEASYQAADGTAVSAVWKSTNQFTAGNTAVPEGVSAVGGKTGTTTAARSCLVQLFTDAQGQRYVAIILGCKERAILYEEMLSFLSNLNN